MPAKTRKSALAGKLGGKLKKAHNAHKSDETVMGSGGDLPEGIENGIAQVVLCKFDRYKSGDNEGEFYFMAQAVVLAPEEIGGIPIKGLRTSIGPEPICDMPDSNRKRNTIDLQIQWIYNELRKMGVDTKEISEDDLETAAAAIEETKPCIRFRTWKGKKQTSGPYKDVEPRVQHEWRGLVDYVPGEEDSGVVDKTERVDESTEEEEAPWNKDAAAEEQTPAGQDTEPDYAGLAAKADGGDTQAASTLAGHARIYGIDSDSMETWADVATALNEADVKEEGRGGDKGEEESGPEPYISTQDLGELADDGDEEAQEKLTALGEQHGVPDEYETWVEWANAIVEAGGTAEANGVTPSKGKVYFHRAKGKRKATEHECTAVFEGRETCNLKDLDSGEIRRAVPWSELTTE